MTCARSRRRPGWRIGLSRQLLIAASVIASAAALEAVQSRAAAPVPSNVTRGCVDRYDPARDYFPDKVTVEDATNFTVTYHRSYKVLGVRAGAADERPERYVLVQCGAPVPKLDAELAGAQVVSVPVASLYAVSTTQLSPLVDLERLDVLTGVASRRFITGDALAAHMKTGQVREFAPVSVVDAELVLSQRPGVFMAGGSESAELAVVRRAGIPVVTSHDWLEPTALARAEWSKYVALFLNEERAAQRLYSGVKTRYQTLRDRATRVADSGKPLVMTGRGTRGDFVIAGGRSYVAALITDAGGRYVWADNTATGSETIDLEAQLRRAGNADIWINGGGWPSLAAMVKDEPRYAEFKAYKTGQVWVYERRLTPSGANDYWSRAISHPDLVLGDLVKIFHPSLAPQRAFEWYLQVPAR
jgi:iron complex transport system substrate-binding protein